MRVEAGRARALGLDLLVLTGGIGEHAPEVRADLARRLAHLGVAVDPGANDVARGDADAAEHKATLRRDRTIRLP